MCFKELKRRVDFREGSPDEILFLTGYTGFMPYLRVQIRNYLVALFFKFNTKINILHSKEKFFVQQFYGYIPGFHQKTCP
jgi:hypothetical protein